MLSSKRDVQHRLNVLILAAGQSESNSNDGNYPLCLAEIKGAPLIQHLVHACMSAGAIHLIVAFRKSDIDEFHLDNVMELLAPTSRIVSAENDTRGAACTALLATVYIDNNEELLIINGNEFLDVDYLTILTNFREKQLDAGTVVFQSIHPRYSYVRLSDDESVIEAAEKRPISRNATAGFYWFARGRDFVRAAQAMIYKDASVNGNFYICPALNELILEQARIGRFSIDINQYWPLKTARQIMREDIDRGTSILSEMPSRGWLDGAFLQRSSRPAEKNLAKSSAVSRQPSGAGVLEDGE